MTQTPTPASPPSANTSQVEEPGRLASLADLALSNSPDSSMERFAQRVRDLVGVPVSLVSLVQADQQVFPGMCGLPEPWAGRRSTPLSHSFCQHVVDRGAPLIIDDTAVEPLVMASAAITDLHVRAYAGMPLTDIDGRVLGSLSAIDVEPRSWTDQQITMLRDLAQDCSHELRLRLSLLDADRERRRRDELETRLTVTLDRFRILLSISESLGETRTEAEIRARLDAVVDPSRGLVSVRLYRLEPDGSVIDLPDALHDVINEVAGRRRVVVRTDLSDPTSAVDDPTVLHYLGDGLRAVTTAPVVVSDRVLGVLELGWNLPHVLDPFELSMVSAVASYVAQALERAQLIEHRTSVAHQLQRSMLTTLPEIAGLSTAACYLPADSAEEVGGDWYDAIILPRIDRDEAGRDVLAVTVGDIVGHDIPAAAVMGQVRAMLRQAAWDQPEALPSSHISSLERACAALGVDACGTAVLGHFVRGPRDVDGWTMTWTNAGHPPPLIVSPEGVVTSLSMHDLMFGYPDLLTEPRGDAAVQLLPGSTVLLYTDGITDRVGHDPDQQLAELGDLLARVHTHGPQALIDSIGEAFGDSNDDIVALAVHVPTRAVVPSAG